MEETHLTLDLIYKIVVALSGHNPNYIFRFNYLKGKYPVDSFHASMTIHKMTTGEINTCYKWEHYITEGQYKYAYDLEGDLTIHGVTKKIKSKITSQKTIFSSF